MTPDWVNKNTRWFHMDEGTDDGDKYIRKGKINVTALWHREALSSFN
jgi:hypothetical protein